MYMHIPSTLRSTPSTLCTCIVYLHVCYLRKISTITPFPLSNHRHNIKWLPTPFYTYGTVRIHLSPPPPPAGTSLPCLARAPLGDPAIPAPFTGPAGPLGPWHHLHCGPYPSPAGLYTDTFLWSADDCTVYEAPDPSKDSQGGYYSDIPVVQISVTKDPNQRGQTFECPVYDSPQRSRLLCTIPVPCHEPPMHWMLRGAALYAC